MIGFLNTANKDECFGCEACAQSCPVSAIEMKKDEEGFNYPIIDEEKCIHCDKCHRVCPYENEPSRSPDKKIVFGGQNINKTILKESTSGGAFSAIVDSWCDENYVVFGAVAEGLRVYHTYVENKDEIGKFRKSKYLQSEMGDSYKEVKEFIKKGKKVLFSGTPCQIAGLKTYLGDDIPATLLTVEVVCEGVPTPLYIYKYERYIKEKYNSEIEKLDYRYKDLKISKRRITGKWDFEVMHTCLSNGKEIKKDRWFNPFWSIWLKHLMSRPSCYKCPFATEERVADITLGDLWGVHLYCPELYEKNTGASLIVCNTEKGRMILKSAKKYLSGHELEFDEALKYQSPMRKHISGNRNREEFMKDIVSLDYIALCKKWADKPNLKLLWQKYIWGNRQKIWVWNLKNRRQK